jgi:hypothetical protein
VEKSAVSLLLGWDAAKLGPAAVLWLAAPNAVLLGKTAAGEVIIVLKLVESVVVPLAHVLQVGVAVAIALVTQPADSVVLLAITATQELPVCF